MARWKDRRHIALVRGIAVQLFFLFVCTVTMLPLFVFGWFVRKKKREHIWRIAIHYLSRLLLFISGIRIQIHGRFPHHDFPAIFVSNHPSMVDPFVFFALFGPNILPLVAPAKSFAFPFTIYLKRFGAVDVLRDEYDKAVYTKSGNRPRRALQKLEHILAEGHNVLIFPEGHIERNGQTHYFHTGAARLSIRTGAPIIPVSIINMDRVIEDTFHNHSGILTVFIGEPIEPAITTKQKPLHHTVKTYRDKIEKAVLSKLPKRAIPIYRTAKHPEDTGVFIDIDRTLYTGYSQQDFVLFLMKRHRLPKRLALHIFRLIILEKLGFLSHEALMRQSLSFLKGKKEVRMDEYAGQFFRKEYARHLNDHMIPFVKDHQEQGHTIVLVTEVIEPLAKQFQHHIHAKTCFETRLRKKHGVYTGEITRLCWKEEKADAAKQFAESYGIDLSQSYAYADSAHDIPLLSLVGHPVAINPDHGLEQKAKTSGWTIVL